MRIGALEAAVILLVIVVVMVLMVAQRQRLAPHAVLEDIFDEPSLPSPGTRARVWAYGVLNEAGVDADADPAYAVKVLRQAEPRLTLEASRMLVATLNGS